MTRAIETLTIERPDWMRDDDWRDIVAQLRASYAAAVEAVDRQRCAEARARRCGEQADPSSDIVTQLVMMTVKRRQASRCARCGAPLNSISPGFGIVPGIGAVCAVCEPDAPIRAR